MAKQLDQILMIDIESTCWMGHPPPGQISEIIEIGICTVDLATLQPQGRRSILVKPQRSMISEFCTDLTSITTDMVAGAAPLSKAVQILRREYQSENRLFGSWGDYDRNQFRRNCQHYHLTYPFGPTHLNVKNLYAIVYGLPQELELDLAMQHVGIEFEGRHHRGVDDAWNMALLYCYVMQQFRSSVCSNSSNLDLDPDLGPTTFRTPDE